MVDDPSRCRQTGIPRMKDVINDLSEYLSGFLPLFVSIIAHPHATVRALVASEGQQLSDIYKRSIMFAIVSLCIGTAIGSYLEISKGPALFDVKTIISAILSWTLVSLALHPAIRLFRGSGSVHSTIVVFLLIVASLHIIWVPIGAVVSKLATNTMVTLNYDYIIGFGSDARSESNLATVKEYAESFIPDREPEKNNTVLVPVKTADDLLSLDARNPRRSQARVAVSESAWPLPTRTESAVIDPKYKSIALIAAALYFLSHFFYLSQGLSAVHGKPWYYWCFLAMAGPPVLLVILFMILVLVINIHGHFVS